MRKMTLQIILIYLIKKLENPISSRCTFKGKTLLLLEDCKYQVFNIISMEKGNCKGPKSIVIFKKMVRAVHRVFGSSSYQLSKIRI